MNIEKAIEFMEDIRFVSSCYKADTHRNKVLEVERLLQRGEIDRKIIDKMKNEKYDVWVSLPGSFTNLPDFVREIEKEVIK